MSKAAEAVVQPAGSKREANPDVSRRGALRRARHAVAAWKKAASDIAAAAVIPVVLLVVWQAAASAGLVSPTFLPSPLTIAGALAGLTVSGDIFHHLGVSVGRAGIGFAAGGSAGLLLGIWTGLFRKAQYLLDPSLQVLRLVPHLAIAPLIILWFGFGEVSKTVIIMTGAFFPLYINTFAGIRNVDGKLFEVARVLAFSPFKRVVRLILPAALPDILLGLRLSLAVSWIGLVVAELIGSQSGIGFLINEAKQNSDTEVIFVGILIFAAVGKLIDSFVRLLERRWLHWRDGYKG
ncbi:ABC transporter permease [Paenibacillus beijingensis]|uniref:ABC transporter permease n=1 Tax=Paenibacillus beijingensis TaxID=1126833 RepID=A0A0D5NF68_9BACL|nr:ABC transporter permease [Paenibacillus beijingensis]AJY73891.1 ABC transporter permease [Paenibacillus beijingensis]